MRNMTRSEYSIRNARTAVIGKIIAILCGYMTRVVFTHVLSQQLVSINGLFSNIFGSLVMTSLGINAALVYALYKPVKENDRPKIRALMHQYRNIYMASALIGAVIFLCIYPLIFLLTKGEGQPADMAGIYGLYLLNLVLSYVDGHYSMIFLAEQRNYINEIFISLFLILQNVLQIVILYLTSSYILYLGAYVLCTLLRNITVAWYAGKTHPWLSDKDHERLSEKETKDIHKNVRAMLLHKVGNTVIGNTDNLILSAMVSILEVGRYSNYYLIIESMKQVIDRGVQGIAGSVGNLAVSGSKEEVQKVFNTTLFAVNWLYGWAAIGIAEILDTFVAISFGSQYMFTKPVVLVLALNFYLNGMRQAVLIFRDSLGLFWFDRYKTIAEALINLLTSIWLAYDLGTTGVFIGTTISIVSVSLWVEPYVLYRHYFQASLKKYFKMFIIYFASTIAAFIPAHCLCLWIGKKTVLSLLIRAIIIFVLPNVIYGLLFRHNREYKTVMMMLKKHLERKKQ